MPPSTRSKRMQHGGGLFDFMCDCCEGGQYSQGLFMDQEAVVEVNCPALGKVHLLGIYTGYGDVEVADEKPHVVVYASKSSKEEDEDDDESPGSRSEFSAKAKITKVYLRQYEDNFEGWGVAKDDLIADKVYCWRCVSGHSKGCGITKFRQVVPATRTFGPGLQPKDLQPAVSKKQLVQEQADKVQHLVKAIATRRASHKAEIARMEKEPKDARVKLAERKEAGKTRKAPKAAAKVPSPKAAKAPTPA